MSLVSLVSLTFHVPNFAVLGIVNFYTSFTSMTLPFPSSEVTLQYLSKRSFPMKTSPIRCRERMMLRTSPGLSVKPLANARLPHIFASDDSAVVIQPCTLRLGTSTTYLPDRSLSRCFDYQKQVPVLFHGSLFNTLGTILLYLVRSFPTECNKYFLLLCSILLANCCNFSDDR